MWWPNDMSGNSDRGMPFPSTSGAGKGLVGYGDSWPLHVEEVIICANAPSAVKAREITPAAGIDVLR